MRHIQVSMTSVQKLDYCWNSVELIEIKIVISIVKFININNNMGKDSGGKLGCFEAAKEQFILKIFSLLVLLL